MQILDDSSGNLSYSHTELSVLASVSQCWSHMGHIAERYTREQNSQKHSHGHEQDLNPKQIRPCSGREAQFVGRNVFKFIQPTDTTVVNSN